MSPWYARKVPVAWEMLMENVNDPANTCFVHHGLQGTLPD
jgi:phenylpropionate dioxygenase-like ring-hydroxylating dioxygenase large terminal subunit